MDSKKAINVLIALNISMGNAVIEDLKVAFTELLRETAASYVSVGMIDFVFTKEEIERRITGNDFDVVITMETLSGVNIGIGSINNWLRINPVVKIIMAVDDDKKGEPKLALCWCRGYYNAVFLSTFSDNQGEIIQLLLENRSKEEALDFYGFAEPPIHHKESNTFDIKRNFISEKDRAREEAIKKEEQANKEPAVENVVVGTTQEPIINENIENEKADENVESLFEKEDVIDYTVSGEMLSAFDEDVSFEETSNGNEVTQQVVEKQTVIEPNNSFMEDIVDELTASESELVDAMYEAYAEIEGAKEEKAEIVLEKVEKVESVSEPANNTVNVPQSVPVEERCESGVTAVRKIGHDIDPDTLNGNLCVMIKGKVNAVIKDDCIIIDCPDGGLYKNAALLTNKEITILIGV